MKKRNYDQAFMVCPSHYMNKFQEQIEVEAVELLTEDIFRLVFAPSSIGKYARPGQFVMVKSAGGYDPLLRRPFSIHDVQEDRIALLFKVVGKGTDLLRQLRVGDRVDLLGPLGNFFRYTEKTEACLVGGGLGIAPLLFLARALTAEAPKRTTVLLGARSRAEVEPLAENFIKLGCTVQSATDDGSYGHHGFVTALLPEAVTEKSTVFVCGPEPLMAAVAAGCREKDIPCQASLETHMACGIGACLGCTVPGSDGNYRHVCTHGPVIDAREVAWKL